MNQAFEAATRATITVGGGRGFVVRGQFDRYVVTAAHCLPHLPPAVSFSDLMERTYRDLLAPLGEEPAVWAECLFVDPIADIALLGPPDNQELSDRDEAYKRLVDSAELLEISEPKAKCRAFLLSLDSAWFECTVQHRRGPLWIFNAARGIVGGMSGSPILAEDGTAIGVMCCSGGTGGVSIEGGPNPRLMGNLPGWYLDELLPRAP